jgi:hypothetical protein
MRLQRSDIAIAMVLVVFCCMFAMRYLETSKLGQFYQHEYAPAVLDACIGTFGNPDGLDTKSSLSSLRDFLNTNADQFDCATLSPDTKERIIPPSSFQIGTFYLMKATSAVWAITGVSWSALAPMAAFLGGLTASAVYAISRLFVSAPWAIAVTALSFFSSANLNMIGHIRDYAKAPFILGCIFFTGWLFISLGRPRRFYSSAALAGTLAGLGTGVRADLIIAPVFFALLLVTLLLWTQFRKILPVLIAGAVFGAAFLISALPALMAYRAGGGALGHVALLGLMTPFSKPLGLHIPIYDIGHYYNDHFAQNIVQAFAYLFVDPPGDLKIHGQAYGNYSLRLLAHIAINFPADILIRVLSAVYQILNINFPSEPYVSGFEYLGYIRPYPTAHGYGVLLFLISICIIFVHRPMLSLFLLIATSFFCGLSALQFHNRHFFHLEFFCWLSGAMIMSTLIPLMWRGLVAISNRVRGRATGLGSAELQNGSESILSSAAASLRALAIPVSAVILTALTLTIARAYQQLYTAKLFDRYLSAHRQPIQLAESQSGHRTLLRPAGPITDMSGTTVHLDQIMPNGFYLVASIDPDRCREPAFRMRVTYKSTNPYDDFSRVVTAPISRNGGETQILFPVFNTAASLFEGLELFTDQRSCLRELAAVTEYRSLPLPLWLRLGPAWKSSYLYQTLEDWTDSSTERETRWLDLLDEAFFRRFDLRPLREVDWDWLGPPAQVEGTTLWLKGEAPRTAYAAKSKYLRLPRGTPVVARGVVHKGGGGIGLLDAQQQWAAPTKVFSSGPFVTMLAAPADGDYQIVLFNNLELDATNINVEIEEVGLVGVEVASAQAANIP